MGRTYAHVRLENLIAKREIDVRALVDSGSVFLTIPSHVAIQLGFEMMDLVVNPALQTLTVNPESPYVAGAKVK
jgi:hypothetical protein